MLIQIHHQNTKTGESSFVAQEEFVNHQKLGERFEELWQSHPPPKGWKFMVCNEDSKYFVFVKEENP